MQLYIFLMHGNFVILQNEQSKYQLYPLVNKKNKHTKKTPTRVG